MSITVLFLLLFAILVYWLMTQILPEWRKSSLLQPGLAEGLVASLNELRHERGLPLLELDDELCEVAENKAVHQATTGRDDEGWEYPERYKHLFGRSLLMEALFSGPVATMVERMSRQREVFDEEWIGCGIGVAASDSRPVVVALILCREAWEPAPDATQHQSLFTPDTRL